MSHAESAIAATGRLDALARQDTAIHRIDPRAKVVTALAFIVVVVSFGKYEISALLPFLLYPVLLTRMGRIPVRPLLLQVALVAPFAILIGVFNPILDRHAALHLGSWGISGGWISFLSILVRFGLTVYAALLLIATTGFDAVCLALTRLKAPSALVTQLLLLYRYLFVLAGEAVRMLRAHALRAVGGQRMPFRIYRSLLGMLLLRALDRAHRLYLAMLCRGFDGHMRLLRPLRLRPGDVAFVVLWCAYFGIARYFNLAQLLGKTLLELFS